MKVLHIITGLKTGGAEGALLALLEGGLARRFDTRVLSLSDAGALGPRIRALGVPVVALGMRPGRPTPIGLAKLHGEVRRYAPDLIQGWMYHGNVAASIGRRLVRRHLQLVWNIRQSLYGLSREKPLTRQVIRLSRRWSNAVDAIVYNSEVSRSQHQRFGFAEEPGLVIPNGFDLDRFGPSPESRSAVRAELGIPDDAPVVGHVARLHPMKDHAGFVRAATRIARADTAAHFVLVGRDVTPQQRFLADQITDRLRRRFHLLGERSDVPAIMAAIDVLCLSSAWGEGFPNVLGEAMASGALCVTTDVGDSATVVGGFGEVVPPGDDLALSEAIRRLLEHRPEQRRELGEGARERIRRHYSLDAVAARYAELYAKLAGTRG